MEITQKTVYTLEDLKPVSAREYRQVPTGTYTVNRNGRSVPVFHGVEYFRTKGAGTLSLPEWYSAVQEAVVREGKEKLLEDIVSVCEHLAWLKTEKEILEYSLECLVDKAYLHWPQMQTEKKKEE